MHGLYDEHDSTLEKRRIADLEELEKNKDHQAYSEHYTQPRWPKEKLRRSLQDSSKRESSERQSFGQKIEANMPRDMRFVYSHPPNLIIGETSSGVKTRASLNKKRGMMDLLSSIEPKNINEALSEDSWVTTMEEELSQFTKNKVQNLVPPPKNQLVIGTKWGFKTSLMKKKQ